MKYILTSMCLFLLSCQRNSVSLKENEINKVNKGGRIHLLLPVSHAQGHSWHLKDDFDRTILEHDVTVWKGEEKGEEFNFKALETGMTCITLCKRMYQDTLDIKQFTVEITGN